MKVVITIPALNEEKTLPRVLEEIKRDVPKSYKYQILVVDDGSRDKTVQVAKKYGAKVVSHPVNYGLARAFQTELKTALKMGADVIVHTDADGQYLARDIPRLIDKLNEGYDLVLGSRFTGKMEGMPFMKKLGNQMFAKTFSKMLKVNISDTTTGFRAFTKHVASEIKFINTFTYTQEQLIRAVKQGFRVAEIPISSRMTRESRLFNGPFDYAIKAWINIIRIYRDFAPLAFFGRIGFFFVAISILLGLWITYTLAMTGSVGGIPRVILTALMFLTGVQIIVLGLIADMMRK